VADDAVLQNAIVGPYASIGRGATVRDSIVRDSVVEERAVITGSRLEQSIVGRRARVDGVFGRVNVGDDSDVGS
jgi:glucose-1-phosphate thymidylyltransferase